MQCDYANDKVMRVIFSCRTLDQLRTAGKYMRLAYVNNPRSNDVAFAAWTAHYAAFQNHKKALTLFEFYNKSQV